MSDDYEPERRCRTCCYWREHKSGPFRSHGTCERVSLGDPREVEDELMPNAMIGTDHPHEAGLVTAPSFGCIDWSAHRELPF